MSMHGKRVYVYWNLHKKCWSLTVGGKVVAHRKSVQLRGCEFRVRPGGRARVLREGKKNVHAFVVGTVDDGAIFGGGMAAVTYNPYKGDSFYLKCNGANVADADVVLLDASGKALAAWL